MMELSFKRIRRGCRLAATALALAVMPALAQAENVTIKLWTHEFPPLQDALTQKLIPEFEAANPGVKVELTAIPFAGVISYDTKILAALEAGSGPDVWDMGSWQYPVMLDAGFLAPLDPTIFGYANVQDLVADYPPGSLDVFLRDGQIHGLFSELNTLALFYNKKMFAEVGISDLPADKPVSWEEICQIGQKLRKQDPNTGAIAQIGYQFGFFAAFRSPQWYAQNYYALLRQFGQDDLYVDGKPAANTDAAIKAFLVIADLTHKCKAYDPNFLANWFADFPNNRVAMVLAGSWFAPAARKENPNVSFGVAPHPVVNPEDKNSFANIVWSWGWSVNANADAERQKAAQQFLAFILGKKGDAAMPAYWFEATGYFQPRKAFLESKQYKDLIAADPWLTQFTRAFELFRTDYVQHSYDEAGAALVRAIDRVVYDGQSARDAAEGLQRELSRL